MHADGISVGMYEQRLRARCPSTIVILSCMGSLWWVNPHCAGSFLALHTAFLVDAQWRDCRVSAIRYHPRAPSLIPRTRFPRIKRRLQQELSDEVFNVVQGNTDSEWAFGLFLSKVW